MKIPWRPRSVKTYLLAWIISPIAIFIVIDTFTLYRGALESANTAYDRMLVTTAYSVGDSLRIENHQLQIPVSYAALEVYEADYSTRMIYRINDLNGRYIAGDIDLPQYKASIKNWPISPTLLEIYDSTYGNAHVRVATVFQPIVSGTSREGTLIQIAEPIENRTNVARKILWRTLVLQALLLGVVAAVTMIVVTRALRPLEALKLQLDGRQDEDLSPFEAPSAARELQPVVNALNQLMARLQRLLGLQQRFVADASHQLRTPLAVLKAQSQSGLRGDAPLELVIREIDSTTDRAINLANQLLSLAKIEQLRGKGVQELCDVATLAQDVAIELSSLISEKNLDFEVDAKVEPAWVRGHPWMITELVSNLLHNAIRHTPCDATLGITIEESGQFILLRVWDTGEGLPDELQSRVFQPFAASHASKGGGLGLTICAEIADSMGATLTLQNRMRDGAVAGLDALVRFKKSSSVEDEPL